MAPSDDADAADRVARRRDAIARAVVRGDRCFFFEIAFAAVGRSGEFVVSHATIRVSAEGHAG